MNTFEKILARASGKKIVEPNEIVEANIDMAMIHDLTGPLTIDSFRKIGEKKIWDPEKIVTIFDHLVPANTIRAASLHKTIREFVEEQNIKNFYDVGHGGICHQVFHERGHARPGELIVGADSHTCTYGALGAFATGIGSTEMAAVLATGKMWFKVPKAIKIEVSGKFRNLVTPKDLILYVIGEIGEGGATYMGMEFVGETIDEMSIDGRLTICNMTVEAGAKTGIVPADNKTNEYVKERTDRSFTLVKSDTDAVFEKIVNVDSSSIVPQVACPSSVDNVKPASDIETEVNQVFIGSCTNGRMEDLRLAAKILKGKKIKPGVRMIVTPASQDIYTRAMKEGLLEIFVNCGGVVTNATCGPCLGGHLGLLAPGEVCLATSNRNFIGRMGSPKSEVYLASPATAAASALAGKIVDPTLQ
ncbi:3-isopropylmalate dehydratase [miscellaneous Crenarchaeota group archaeon SMTZ-80]|nr:MAG: 3-isopropylmalate dehydratase [miscellaneous Crenarchaeota group archaeon SMTZ-80]